MQKVDSNITLVITSCDRLPLLKHTVESFTNFADIVPGKTILIENSGKNISEQNLKDCLKLMPNSQIIINSHNMGQIRSIDKAYALVDTQYIFHLEDDWEFYDTGFMAKSLDVLQQIPNIINVNLRRRNDGTRGSMHPVSELMTTSTGTKYHTYNFGYNGIHHGFAFNPGLRRLADYKVIGRYQDHGNEEQVGDLYRKYGYQAACLEQCYCKHSAEWQTTPGANQ